VAGLFSDFQWMFFCTLQNGFLANIDAADEITEAQLNQEINELTNAEYV